MSPDLEYHIQKLHSEIYATSQMYRLAKEIGEYSYVAKGKDYSNIFWHFQYALKRESEMGLARIFDGGRKNRRSTIYTVLGMLCEEAESITLKDKLPFGEFLVQNNLIDASEVSCYEVDEGINKISKLYLKKWPENKTEWPSEMGKFIKYRRNMVLAHPEPFSREHFIDTTYHEFNKILSELEIFSSILLSIIRNIGRLVDVSLEAPVFEVKRSCDERSKEFYALMGLCNFQLNNEF